MRTRPSPFALAGVLALAALAVLLAGSQDSSPTGDVARGKYLVIATGCGDCHTPMKMGPAGPEPDASRTMSGHPQMLVMPPAPALPQGPWMAVVSATFTAWSGPWGTSFTANLTPDHESGLGAWNARTFVDTIRSGRVMAKGRLLLPPMPVPAMQNLTDGDLASIFAYLQTLPAIVNKVPEPVPPTSSGTSRTTRPSD
jgi:mono/diheme cytochrome c family protein